MRNSWKWLLMLSLGLCACSPEASKVYMKPVAQKEKVTENPDALMFDPQVDILFVVDNSGSMYSHQQNLASNISLFTSKFSKNSILDYNIGVLTTDMGYYRQMGTLVGSPRVVTKLTPNGDAALARNLQVGTNGSAIEKSFDPILKALEPQMLAGPNFGFYRPTAALAVIFITDAEDQSRASANQLYQQLLQMKKSMPQKVLAYGVIVPSWVSNCDRDEMVRPDRIEEFLKMVFNGSQGKNIFSLCDPSFGAKIADMAKDIVDIVGRVIYLNRVPAVDTIRVTYGSVELPWDADKGWSFDPKRNAIILGEKIDWNSQPFGSRVSVQYETARFEDQ
jgi:hypothetical protein